MQEGKDGNVQSWQARPQNSLLPSRTHVDFTESLEQAEYYQSLECAYTINISHDA